MKVMLLLILVPSLARAEPIDPAPVDPYAVSPPTVRHHTPAVDSPFVGLQGNLGIDVVGASFDLYVGYAQGWASASSGSGTFQGIGIAARFGGGCSPETGGYRYMEYDCDAATTIGPEFRYGWASASKADLRGQRVLPDGYLYTAVTPFLRWQHDAIGATRGGVRLSAGWTTVEPLRWMRKANSGAAILVPLLLLSHVALTVDVDRVGTPDVGVVLGIGF